MIVFIWVFSFALALIPLTEICGKFGYDAVHGKCHIIECEHCSERSSFRFPPGGVIHAVGVGLPFIVVLVSYGLVYRTLKQCPPEVDTVEQIRSVKILTCCYFLFILPIAIIEWLPEIVTMRAFVSIIFYLIYWFIYIINFFIYIISWRRIRDVMLCFLKDILEVVGLRIESEAKELEDSSSWWQELRTTEKPEN